MRQIDRPADLATLFATFQAASLATRETIGARSHTGPRHAGHLLRRALEIVRLWQRRARGRKELRSFDDHLLRDIGITRVQAEAEAHKPFWRA